MVQAEGQPTVVIVGRPNVGKSTLFNCILGQRRSIVGDEPGITRDRIVGCADYRGRQFELVDTGGIIPNDDQMIPTQILKQARVALDRAARIIFLIDGRSEITGVDRDLAQMLKRLGKPVALAVNKLDTAKRESLAHDFYSLGFNDIFAVSAEHRMGIDDLLDFVTQDFPISKAKARAKKRWDRDQAGASGDGGESGSGRPRIKVAIIGRPNVGKSTLLNVLTGSERAIVSPVAGTTRDAVDESVVIGDTEFVFVDTAGIRRKGKTHLMAEKLSVVMARRHIRMANVALLVVDASEGVVAADATIGGYAVEEGRGVIVVVNKWDAAAPQPDGRRGKQPFIEAVRDAMKFMEFAPIVFISAIAGTGVDEIPPLIERAYAGASRRITTGELNRFAEGLTLEPDVKVRYMTQASMRPPTFVLFTDQDKPLHFSAERHLINRLRKTFGFEGTPVRVLVRPRKQKEARHRLK
jgi:GTPase